MKINDVLKKLKESIYVNTGKLQVDVWVTQEPASFRNRYSGKHLFLKQGDKWGSLFDSGWFHFTGTVPQYKEGFSPVLLIDINGEMLLYDKDGSPVRGLTSNSSVFDRSLGSPVKRVFYLPRYLKTGDTVDYWADAGCNDLFGELQKNGTLSEAFTALCNEDIRKVYYDYEFFLDILKNNPPDSDLYKRVHNLAEEGSLILRDLSADSLNRVSCLFSKFFRKKESKGDIAVSAIGHSHLDLAWLWPLRETRRKIGRTLASAFELMERYPGYVFGLSQPQLLVWLEKDYPSLYVKLMNLVKCGQVEPLGAGWVEFDTNIPGGESLVRQIIYGKQFWREKFGIDMDFLWLPDSFGFSGSLPQIMKGSGLRFLITMKLAWNSVNKFPYHSFRWSGIDGSEIFVHILPEGTYNSPALPESVLKIRDEYNEKDVSSHALMVYGIGDGGGGPGAEHLERLKRLETSDLFPVVKKEKVSTFLNALEKEAKGFPLWRGDLYLEKHQGTFTTEALSKFHNRELEHAMYRYELVSVLAFLSGKVYPRETIEKMWKEILLYQFHDILPGTSIKRVYDESWLRYRGMISFINEQIDIILKGYLRESREGEGIFAFNFLSHEISGWQYLNNFWYRVTVPGIGCCPINLPERSSDFSDLKAESNRIENEFLLVSFNSDGTIGSIIVKEENKEYINKKGGGNILAVYKDSGDAWDFSKDYRNSRERMKLTSYRFKRSGPFLMNIQTFVYGSSILTQKIIIASGEKKIDFETEIIWNDQGRVLRTSFDIDLPNGKAFCGSAFGAIERPVADKTSWDRAKDEIPCHGWADISDGRYGAALISDAKYGYRVKGYILDLCILRSVPYPGSALLDQGYTDMGQHSFSYSFYPHKGDYAEGDVINVSMESGCPVKIVYGEGRLNKSRDLKTLFSTGNNSVIISAVKKAEEGEGIIIRCYESSGKGCDSFITVDPVIMERFTQVYHVNLVEDYISSIPFVDNRIKISFKPFEIVTIKLIQ